MHTLSVDPKTARCYLCWSGPTAYQIFTGVGGIAEVSWWVCLRNWELGYAASGDAGGAVDVEDDVAGL